MKKQISDRQLFPTAVLLAAFLSLLFSVRPVGAEEAVSSSTSEAAALTENPAISDASVASHAESPSAESGESRPASEEAVEKAELLLQHKLQLADQKLCPMWEPFRENHKPLPMRTKRFKFPM